MGKEKEGRERKKGRMKKKEGGRKGGRGGKKRKRKEKKGGGRKDKTYMIQIFSSFKMATKGRCQNYVTKHKNRHRKRGRRGPC